MSKILIGSKPRFLSEGYWMGDGVLPPPGTFEILYHRLQVTVSGASPGLVYLNGSGIYSSATYNSIGNFFSAWQGSTLSMPGNLHNGLSDAPHIQIERPSYIVIEISSDNQPSLCFQDNVPALQTLDDHSTEYRGLTRADNEKGSKIIYFEAFNPRSTGDDSYGIFLQYGSGSTVQSYPIDPKIKNRSISGGGSGAR